MAISRELTHARRSRGGSEPQALPGTPSPGALPQPHSEGRRRPRHPWDQAPLAVTLQDASSSAGGRASVLAAEPGVEGVRSAQAKSPPGSSQKPGLGVGGRGFLAFTFSSDNDGDPNSLPCHPRQQRRGLPAG